MSSLANQPIADDGLHDTAAARIEQLYASHSALVRSVCFSVLRDRMEAEDAAQQTFLSAQRALQSGSSPRDAAAWLVTIARHESFGRVRTRMREPLPVDDEAEGTGADAYAAAVRRQEVGELRDALEELPAQQREALLLREVRGLSYEEVASTLSVTSSAVESLLFRARRSLQVRLREAFATFSPAGLAHELAARLGGGVVAPAVGKALAVGVGAAVVTSGAVVGPQLIGRGHAPVTRATAKPQAVQQGRHGRLMFNVPSRSWRAPLEAAAASTGPIWPETRDHSSEGELASRSGNTEGQETPARASSDAGGDSSSTSDRGSSTEGGGTSSDVTQPTSSGGDSSSTDSNSQTTTTSSGSDGSGDTTTTSAPGGD